MFESAAHVLAVRRASLSPDVAGSKHRWNLLSAFFVARVEKTPDLKKPLTSKFCGLELPTQKAKVQNAQVCNSARSTIPCHSRFTCMPKKCKKRLRNVSSLIDDEAEESDTPEDSASHERRVPVDLSGFMSPYRPRASGRPEPVKIQIMNRRGVIMINFRFHDGINECLREIKIPQTGYAQVAVTPRQGTGQVYENW